MKNVRLMAAAGFALWASAGAAQVALPYDRTGQLDGVDATQRVVYIDDSRYQFEYGMPVYSSYGNSMPLSGLKPGKVIGYTTNPDNWKEVTGIWVLKQ